MKHYKDIFIDFDDTLYDTFGNSIIALNKLYEERHWEQFMPPFAEFRDVYFAVNDEVWTKYAHGSIDRDTLIVERFRRPLTEMIRRKGGDPSLVTPGLCKEINTRYLDLISQEKGVVEGAPQLLKYLSAKGYRLHICSNGFHEVQYRKLRSSGLEGFFTSVILSDDAGTNKPSREFFDYAIKKTGAARDTTVMIGDHYDTDIAGAEGAGIDTVYFLRHGSGESHADGKATYTVRELKDIENIL